MGMARVWTGVGAMKPSSSIAREMSGWIASSPKRAVGGARVNVSPVLFYMLTGETLPVNELFQRKTIQFGDDLLGVRFRSRSRLTGRGIAQRDHGGDRRLRRNAEVLAHPVVFVGSDRVRAAADAKSPRGDHHVLGDASRIETQSFVEKHDRDRDGAAVEVPRRHQRVREIVAVLPFLEYDEPPRLRVLGASGRPSGLQDLGEHVLRDGTIRVLADFAFRNDSQVSVHPVKYRRPDPRVGSARIPNGPAEIRGGIAVRLKMLVLSILALAILSVAIAGSVAAFLCGGGSKPAPCVPGTANTGTITPADVIGPTGQGIAPGEWNELVAAIRAGVAYANVHSTTQTGGEIRGQINDKDQRD